MAATVAVRGFTVALLANPLGLVAVAVSTTIAALVTLTKWFKKSAEVAAKAKEVFDIVKDHSRTASDSLVDNFANATFGVGCQMRSLKETCSDFFKQLQADILKMTLKQRLSSIFGNESANGGLSGSAAGSGGNITVNMNIQTPDIASFNHSRSQIASDMCRQIAHARKNL